MRLRHLCPALLLVLWACACLSAYGEKRQVLFGCYARPETVHPSEPVAITGSQLYLAPNKPAEYTWQTTGGRLAPTGDHATVNTSGLAPGEYTVTGRVVQGQKPKEQSTCTARFRVIPFEPPTVSCRTNPTTGPSGATFDVYNTAISPYNRPFSYSFATSAGRLTSTGSTAKLATKDVAAGTIHVTCYAVDDRGLSASGSTDVVLTKPLQEGSSFRRLCSLGFAHTKKYPVRVDGPAESCLDSIASTMQLNPTSRLVVVGNTLPSEPPEAAAERSLNVRQYLVSEKGINPVRIELRVGVTSGPSVDNTLVSPGLEFNEPNTQLFDESSIVRHGPPYVIVPRTRRLNQSRRGATSSF